MFDAAVNQFPVVAIIPDDLVGNRRGTCRWETPPPSPSHRFLPRHPARLVLPWFSTCRRLSARPPFNSHHHRGGLKPIDHALDYSGLELARHSRGQSHSLAFVSPPLVSLSSRRSSPFGRPQQQPDHFSGTLTNQSHWTRNVVSALLNGSVPYYQFSFVRQGNCQEAQDFSSPTLSIGVIELGFPWEIANWLQEDISLMVSGLNGLIWFR